MNNKEATYSLCVEDVLQQARERGVKIHPDVKDDLLINWLQLKMPDFFGFASEQLLNACVDVFKEGEIS